ncbi:alpha-ketoglutarate-dependent dioxygenase AlkB [Methylomonas sp. AM2-LC]|uniref:alpha-ketoglutarate-dependent dioxygenase AlkB family protein n=1 Tax=Methylomonas sp. AM2-LC TaxID=3153301 RepID=UPI0032660DA5
MAICHDFDTVEGFYTTTESEDIYNRLRLEQNWPDNRYYYAGRKFVLPRLQTWHADAGIHYSYSNNLLETRPWTPLLSEIRARVEGYLHVSFNAVLVNCYRNGEDHVGWHADNEPELGEQPFIASLSFGATRSFEFKHKKSDLHAQILLRQGDLLVMHPRFQQNWLHRVPIDQSVKQSRINLTFRRVVV